ncbi:retron St85 family RNA-directed DNA polymerase [Sulfitobacter pseudonitzschiae]|uniref:Retron St85 family RNA-directed DNA polymerase n=1 Tax=Pseudosulfitobacter pseudonitzschiae TaxID=1402135 RepID=A0A9Q2NZ42_9RHOB|nr:retron St85 family RNA-directed DNA polymerase [Pseudosulfitobacter pseudonitzschiae]MBM2291435.1 retron St85 family RNA-directed DNA polymerase [Pseudosulfitobacter pseudonitzschiae]MBM2296353.1 retron St85 family RNA-directed DNA polymerase [Pseudosulfitobacter pseudonitzschiae]MBM2301266.1 retron St85 family RNA-directed DNA polymerase [Pseudosulfitobacter pseudonitzschiae]MBM2311050.1 retron St85 family RNA-directed DNA polymerase [Pseudosulfitobacter pseudonitzschiae]MBM2315963.1 retro
MLIDQIARSSQLEVDELVRLAQNASQHYKLYNIPKRNGEPRRIAHPSRELKAIQRWIVKVIIQRFPIHDAATAYRTGGGIRENAERHRISLYTNRYDFANFFPSFKREQVQSFIQSESEKVGLLLSDDDADFVGKIVCRYDRLTIGAPSSPSITNAMMFPFDQILFDYCVKRDLIYTRYADDIFISANKSDQLNNLEVRIADAKRKIPHLSIRLNRQKTAYLSKKYHRSITGVVITPDHKLSVGRSRKREIRALVHRWINGKLDPIEVSYMRGLIAFARDIEPKFEVALRAKYGPQRIEEILRRPDLTTTPGWPKEGNNDDDVPF